MKMRNLYSFFCVALILTGLSSCTKQYQVLFEKQAALNDSLYSTKSEGLGSYKIKPQDILQIRNLQNIRYIVDETPTSPVVTTGGNSVGQNFKVEEDGNVILPLIGQVHVVGLTRLEAQTAISNLYSKTIINPIIDLKIINLKITILGEVHSQGNLELTKDKTTLIDIIGQAGGLTPAADEKHIKIIRGTNKTPLVNVIDLNTVQSINDPRAVLQNGDIIYIAQSKRAARNDNITTANLLFQPISLILSTVVLLLTLNRIR